MTLKHKWISSLILIGLFMPTTALAEAIQIRVKGVVCTLCAQGIEKILLKNDAVQDVDVSLTDKTVTVTTKPDQTLTDQSLTKMIQDAGYNVVAIERQS